MKYLLKLLCLRSSLYLTVGKKKKRHHKNPPPLHNNALYLLFFIWMMLEGKSKCSTDLNFAPDHLSSPSTGKSCLWLQLSLGLPGFGQPLLLADSRADCPEHDLLASQHCVWLQADLLTMFSDFLPGRLRCHWPFLLLRIASSVLTGFI